MDKKNKLPFLRLFIAMLIGLFVIEMMIELSTGTTLMGGSNGIFISRPHSNANAVNTQLKADARTIQVTEIREAPDLDAMKVGKIEVGANLRVVGKTTVDKEVWYQVQRFGGKIGYVSANTVVIK